MKSDGLRTLGIPNIFKTEAACSWQALQCPCRDGDPGLSAELGDNMRIVDGFIFEKHFLAHSCFARSLDGIDEGPV